MHSNDSDVIYIPDYAQSTCRKLFKVSGRVAFIQFNPSRNAYFKSYRWLNRQINAAK